MSDIIHTQYESSIDSCNTLGLNVLLSDTTSHGLRYEHLHQNLNYKVTHQQQDKLHVHNVLNGQFGLVIAHLLGCEDAQLVKGWLDLLPQVGPDLTHFVTTLVL